MQTGLNLVELAKKLQAQQNEKQDFLADTRDLTMVVEGDQPKMHINGQAQVAIRPVAHDQIASYTGIPARYYDRLATEAPALLANNVNTWLSRHKPERRMVRTLKSTGMRAFLSDKYQRVEHFDIANAALEVLHDMKVDIVSSRSD